MEKGKTTGAGTVFRNLGVEFPAGSRKRAIQTGGVAFRDQGVVLPVVLPLLCFLFLGEIGVDGRLDAGVEMFGRNGLFYSTTIHHVHDLALDTGEAKLDSGLP
jgi:hypothetical protein